MRATVLGLLLLVASPAFAEQARDPDVDRYFSCIVGDGAVELHYGKDAEAAWIAGVANCAKIHDELVKAGRGDDAYGASHLALTLLQYIAPGAT